MKTITLIVLIFCFKINFIIAQFNVVSGLSYSTESFNIQNTANINGSAYDNIQFDPGRFFSTVHFNAGIQTPINKSLFLSVETYTRFNHHYYKRIPRQNGLEPHNDIPQKRKIKFDVFLDLNKIMKLNKYLDFVFGVGVGVNNINSSYDFTYYDTLSNGQAFNRNFKGNWLKVTPRIFLGGRCRKYSFIFDGIFTKDPTFENLLSINVRATVKRIILNF